MNFNNQNRQSPPVMLSAAKDDKALPGQAVTVQRRSLRYWWCAYFMFALLVAFSVGPGPARAAGGFPIVGILRAGDRPEALAVDTETHVLYIAYETAGQIVAFAPIGGQVLWRAHVGDVATDVQVDSATHRVYVVSFSFQEKRSILAVLDGATGRILFNTFVERGALTKDFTDNDLAIDGKRQRVYVSDYQDITVNVFTFAAANGGNVTATSSSMQVGLYPQALGVNSRLGRLYVADRIENTITVIDEDSGRTLATIDVCDVPVQPLRVDEVTGRVYVVCSSGQEMDVIDGKTNHVIARVPVAPYPEGVDFSSATNRIYIADEGNDESNNNDQSTGTTITVVDEQSFAVLGTLEVGRAPDGIAVDSQLRRVYVSTEGSNAVVEISDSVDVILQAGDTAHQLADVHQALAFLQRATLVTLLLMVLTMVGATIRALAPRWHGLGNPRRPPGGASSRAGNQAPP